MLFVLIFYKVISLYFTLLSGDRVLLLFNDIDEEDCSDRGGTFLADGMNTSQLESGFNSLI